MSVLDDVRGNLRHKPADYADSRLDATLETLLDDTMTVAGRLVEVGYGADAALRAATELISLAITCDSALDTPEEKEEGEHA